MKPQKNKKNPPNLYVKLIEFEIPVGAARNL